tara:strand:- start:174 stop:1436 length:1263 start_codon:yes stop_codon:yes gene_type:complete
MINLISNFINKFKRKIFPFYKNKELKLVFNILQKDLPKEIVAARFVGGCVRKYLTGEQIDDIDIATILTTDEVKQKFKNTNFKVIETGVEHGTVTLLSNDHKLEVTTLRKDIKSDGRHAKVEFTDNWLLDSERRDFTINAIYMNIDGKIFDPQNGKTDLKNKNVKFIGDPNKRIEEDYLRIIRFLRFKIMYNMDVENSTSNAIKENLDGIKKISKERVLLELLKILDLKNFTNINDNNYLKEIFSLIFPEFLYLNRLGRLKKVREDSKLNRYILLAILLIDEKDNHEYFAHKYNVSKNMQNNLNEISSNLKKIKYDKNFLDKNLDRNIYIFGKSHLIALNLINFTKNSKIKFNEFSRNIRRILKFSMPTFRIDGEYLKRNGMKEGETLGKVLKIIEEEWIKNSFKISENRIREIIKLNSN